MSESKQNCINCKNKRWLVYYYTNDFKFRRYTFVLAQNLNEAWIKSEKMFGIGNIESVIKYDIK